MRDYIKLGFLNPTEISRARHMTRKQVLGYFALLALLITLSMSTIITGLISNLRDDGAEISEKVPSFEITDSKIVTDEGQESYIHQTDSFLFFFDPNGEIEEEEITTNLNRLNVPVGIALLEDSFQLYVIGQNLPLSYDQIDGFDRAGLLDIFQQIGSFSPLVLFFIFIVAFLASSFSLIYRWLLIALMTNIVSTLLRLRFPFKKNARVALVSLTIPVLGLALVEAFGIFIPYSFELTIAFALFFIYSSYKRIAPKIEKK